MTYSSLLVHVIAQGLCSLIKDQGLGSELPERRGRLLVGSRARPSPNAGWPKHQQAIDTEPRRLRVSRFIVVDDATRRGSADNVLGRLEDTPVNDNSTERRTGPFEAA